MVDKRPDPKPRKHPQLWQAYLWWYELVELRKKHKLRLDSITKGKSNMDGHFENDIINAMQLDKNVERSKGIMIDFGSHVGPIWDWTTSIKGLGSGSMAAQLISQIDDIAKFPTISKLWRFCGYGLYMYWMDEKGTLQTPLDGWVWKKVVRKKQWVVVLSEEDKLEYNNFPEEVNSDYEFIKPDPYLIPQVKFRNPKDNWKLKRHRDVNLEGYHSPYNNTLKALMWNIAESFVKQQTDHYTQIYYLEKEKQRRKYPEPQRNGNGKKMYTDGHINNRAKRKMIQAFLKDFWLAWRTFEGLPLTEEYSETRI